VFDPLSVSDLVHDELRQRMESGYDISGIEADLAATPTDDLDRLEALYLQLITTQRRSDWAYEEPESLDDILEAMPAVRSGLTAVRQPRPRELADRILGGWLGRIAGCNLGKPIEDGDFWTAGLHPCPRSHAQRFPAARKLAGNNSWPGPGFGS